MSNTAVQAAIAAAAQQTNMNEAQKGGGGSYEPPAAGLARLRLVGYIETGKEHDERYSKTKDKVRLIFELSGPKHKPKEVEEVPAPYYRVREPEPQREGELLQAVPGHELRPVRHPHGPAPGQGVPW